MKVIDCKYCVENNDSKIKLPFYCNLKLHNVSKKLAVTAKSEFS